MIMLSDKICQTVIKCWPHVYRRNFIVDRFWSKCCRKEYQMLRKEIAIVAKGCRSRRSQKVSQMRIYLSQWSYFLGLHNLDSDFVELWTILVHVLHYACLLSSLMQPSADLTKLLCPKKYSTKRK